MMKAIIFMLFGGVLVATATARVVLWSFIMGYNMGTAVAIFCFISMVAGMLMLIGGADMVDKL